MIEKLVQLLVRVIDAQLLEAVDGEVLEAEYVQNAEEPRAVLAGVRAIVYVVDQPDERTRVQRLRHRVPVLAGLLNLQRYLGDVAADVYLPYKHHFREILDLQAEQGRDRADDVKVLFS